MAGSKRAHRYLKGSLKFLVITTLVIIVSYGLLNVVAVTQETASAILQGMGAIES
jgi:putative flippase GtrA